jgi:hypothetical protein
MDRPDRFQVRYRTIHQTPFQAIDSTVKEPDGSGVVKHDLDPGQLVWMEPLPAHPGGRTALGYVDGYGLILLDYHSLRQDH